MRAGCSGSLVPSGENCRAGREEEERREGKRRKDTSSCDISEDSVITESGLVLIDAGCRKRRKERGRRLDKGRGI